MKRRLLLALTAASFLAGAPAALAGTPGHPSLSICRAVTSGGSCTGGWVFQGASGDACGANVLSDGASVWIDDTIPASYTYGGYTGRTAMAVCETWGGLNRSPANVFVGCYISGAGRCLGSDGGGPVGCCENLGEYYPFHQLANTDTKQLSWSPWNTYGACTSNVNGRLNGFITQQNENLGAEFGIDTAGGDSDTTTPASRDTLDGDGDAPPDSTQSGGEWSYALGCTTRYAEPMGTF